MLISGLSNFDRNSMPNGFREDDDDQLGEMPLDPFNLHPQNQSSQQQYLALQALQNTPFAAMSNMASVMNASNPTLAQQQLAQLEQAAIASGNTAAAAAIKAQRVAMGGPTIAQKTSVQLLVDQKADLAKKAAAAIKKNNDKFKLMKRCLLGVAAVAGIALLGGMMVGSYYWGCKAAKAHGDKGTPTPPPDAGKPKETPKADAPKEPAKA